MSSINYDISGKEYQTLMQYICNNSNIVSFSTENKIFFSNESMYEIYINKIEQFIKNVEKCIIRKRVNDSRFISTKIISEEKENYLNMRYFLKITPEITRILLKEEGLKSWRTPYLPQDFIFINNNAIRMITISHEEMCDIYCDNEQEYKILKNMGIKFYDEYNPVEEQKDRMWQEMALLQKNEINILKKEIENGSY